MKKIAILFLLLSALVTAAHAACTDPGGGAAQLCNDDGYLICDQQRPIVVQYPNASKTQNACTNSTVLATDIGTTTPTAGAIPVAGTSSTIDRGWLPTSLVTSTATSTSYTNVVPKFDGAGGLIPSPITAPRAGHIDIPYSNADSSAAFGMMEFQAPEGNVLHGELRGSLITRNVYWDQTYNDGEGDFFYRANGPGSILFLNDGSIDFQTCSSGVAGANSTCARVFAGSTSGSQFSGYVSGSNLTSAGEALADVHKTDTISASGGDYAFAYRTGTNTTTNTATGTGTSCPLGNSCTMVRTSTTTSTATVTNSVNGIAISMNPVLDYTNVGALPTSALPTPSPGWLHDNGYAVRAWSTPTAADVGAANTALSNLSSVAINASLLPGTSASIDLGSTSYKWRASYFSGQVNAATVYTTGDVSAGGAVYGANLTSAGHAAADVAAADFFTFGGVFTNSNPGYFDTNSTDYVDFFTVAIASVPAGTHYLSATVAAAVTMPGGSCNVRMLLDSAPIGNEVRTDFIDTPVSMTAGHVSIGSGTHTLHLQVSHSIGGTYYCRVTSGRVSASGMVTPN